MKFIQYAYRWNVSNSPINTSCTNNKYVSVYKEYYTRSETNGCISKSDGEENSRGES